MLLLTAVVCPSAAIAASHVTANFDVTSDSAELAETVAKAAESCRLSLAEHWLGHPLPAWKSRCRITVVADPAGGGTGWTSYLVTRGSVEDIEITLRGRPDRLLEFVLPHEITHTVLVTSLGKLIPRWADEGTAMMSESEAQRLRQRLILRQFLQSKQAPRLRSVLALVEYPDDKRQIRAFYAASLSLTEFLVARSGRSKLFRFLNDGERIGWDRAIRRHYAFEDVESLESAWIDWVAADSTPRRDFTAALERSSSSTGD